MEKTTKQRDGKSPSHEPRKTTMTELLPSLLYDIDPAVIRRKEATDRQPATLSCGVASIAFVLPGAPQKRAALCAERGPTPITPARKERQMTDRKRTTAIQVRVTEQEIPAFHHHKSERQNAPEHLLC